MKLHEEAHLARISSRENGNKATSVGKALSEKLLGLEFGVECLLLSIPLEKNGKSERLHRSREEEILVLDNVKDFASRRRTPSSFFDLKASFSGRFLSHLCLRLRMQKKSAFSR